MVLSFITKQFWVESTFAIFTPQQVFMYFSLLKLDTFHFTHVLADSFEHEM